MYVSSLLPRHKLCWLGRCCNERLRWATMARGLHCSAMILIIWDEVMDPPSRGAGFNHADVMGIPEPIWDS